jgi:hypothetical protein
MQLTVHRLQGFMRARGAQTAVEDEKDDGIAATRLLSSYDQAA